MVQDRPALTNRRLSAILAADVAGYSRLMHADEEGTHTKLTALLADVVYPAIGEHGGRIVKCTGDGFLAEFASAVSAIRAADQFQRSIFDQTVNDPDVKRILFRVGINLGDVIVEPHDIFGDDVNIAARLEGISEPGGIVVSSSIYDHVRGRTPVEFTDLGDQHLKNISHPIRAYAVVRDKSTAILRAVGIFPSALLPRHLSIVVLPFENLSGEPEQDYFVDGVTESLTTDLSRISGSFVIGRHTAFTYKGKAVDLKQIGRDLNVRYVLEGSVQRSGSRLRVNAKLVGAETGAHLWADRFDKPVANLFDMQDEIVSRLANTLDARLTEEEARRSEQSVNPNSMDLYFQGRALCNKSWAPATLAQAGRLFERAVALDGNDGMAQVWIAGVGLLKVRFVMDCDRAALLAAAETRLLDVLSTQPNLAFAHLALGVVLANTNRTIQAIAEYERSLALDPNLAQAHAQIGSAKWLSGRSEETPVHIAEAFRLSPCDVFVHQWLLTLGAAKFHAGCEAECVSLFRRSIETNRQVPLAHFLLASVLALRGSLDEAKSAADAGFALDPGFTLRRYRQGPNSQNPIYLAKRERFFEGMRLAGIPEG